MSLVLWLPYPQHYQPLIDNNLTHLVTTQHQRNAAKHQRNTAKHQRNADLWQSGKIIITAVIGVVGTVHTTYLNMLVVWCYMLVYKLMHCSSAENIALVVVHGRLGRCAWCSCSILHSGTIFDGVLEHQWHTPLVTDTTTMGRCLVRGSSTNYIHKKRQWNVDFFPNISSVEKYELFSAQKYDTPGFCQNNSFLCHWQCVV